MAVNRPGSCCQVGTVRSLTDPESWAVPREVMSGQSPEREEAELWVDEGKTDGEKTDGFVFLVRLTSKHSFFHRITLTRRSNMDGDVSGLHG